MGDDLAFENRRRHVRVPLGLPVQIYIGGDRAPITVELVDLAEGGVRFRALGDEGRARVGQRARFTASHDITLDTFPGAGHVFFIEKIAPKVRTTVSDWLTRHSL